MDDLLLVRCGQHVEDLRDNAIDPRRLEPAILLEHARE